MSLGKAHIYFPPPIPTAESRTFTHSSASSALSIRAEAGWFWSKSMAYFGGGPGTSNR